MHRRSRLVVIGALLLAACAPDPGSSPDPDAEPTEELEFEEVCGTRGPHRLFALRPGEWLHPDFGKWRIDDRLYFIDGTGETDFLGTPTPETARVYSTGLCGEDRRFIADDIRRVFESKYVPGALFGCRREISGDLFLLDPSGETAPRLLATDGCEWGTWTAHGLVREDQYSDDASRILFYPYPADLGAGLPEPIVLADSLKRRFSDIFIDPDVGEILAVDLDENLLRISLPGGETSIEQAAARDAHVTRDGRWLVWEDLLTASGDIDEARGDFVLRDRRTGVDTVVARAPHDLRMRLRPDTLELSPGTYGGGRLIALPSLVEAEIPEDRRLRFDFDELWVLQSEDGSFYVRDPFTGAERFITDDPGSVFSSGLDGMLMLRLASESDPHLQLWRYPFDGGAPELQANRVTQAGWLADRRVYTLVDVDAEGVGDLVLVDPETLEERFIDGDVTQTPYNVQWHTTIVERDTIAYQVLDGERSGLWIARPAALPAAE